MTILKQLGDNLRERQRFLLDLKGEKPDKRNKAWVLWDCDPEELITVTYGQVLSKVEIGSSLTDLVRGIGSTLNRKLKLRTDEIAEMHLGWFIFVAYMDLNILTPVAERAKKQGRRQKHTSYRVRVTDVESLNTIMELIDVDRVELFPSCKKPAHWIDKRFHHPETEYPIIKKDPHEDAVKAFKRDGAEYLVRALNKLGDTGWRINRFVFDVFMQCTNLPKEESPFKFMKEVDKEKRASLEIEARAVQRLAERHLDNVFYHLYNVDFRGRIYPNTAFLHEQSSDNAKGLLLLDEPVALGEEGYYWLSVHTANMFGEDKLKLDERVKWVEDNIDDILSYAENPMTNRGWMNADKPFCFLACCSEISMINDWVANGQTVCSFPSCLPVYVDGSNNGVQHLAAMAKDPEVGPLVNLVPLDKPGDVYMFIAEKTIENVKKDASKLDKNTIEGFKELREEFVKVQSDVDKYSVNTRSELFSQSLKRRTDFGNKNYDAISRSAPLYWANVSEKKLWRKTVKRPVMTLGYGGTTRGMQEMVHDDTRGLGVDYLRDKHKAWSVYLGNLIYKTCYEELPGPASMLRMFERLGAEENEKDRPIAYRQIVTGFPFVHRYKKAATKQVLLYYGDTSFRLNVRVWKEATLDKQKQKQSTAPNIVHSIDAVHLSMYVVETDYPVTVVHDSFGCHAGNMAKAFYDVRKKFVELYEMEPLEFILKQMDATHLIPAKGNLDVSNVMESDFAFA